MKRLVLLIAVLIVAMGLQAQDYESRINRNESYVYKSMSTHTLTNVDTVDVVVQTRINNPFTIDVCIYVDSISGDAGCTLYLEGRKADSEAWSSIANTAWSGDDSTVIVSHATAVRYRETRLRLITSGTGVLEADYYWEKLWYE